MAGATLGLCRCPVDESGLLCIAAVALGLGMFSDFFVFFAFCLFYVYFLCAFYLPFGS
jgi:hypothetical protein